MSIALRSSPRINRSESDQGEPCTWVKEARGAVSSLRKLLDQGYHYAILSPCRPPILSLIEGVGQSWPTMAGARLQIDWAIQMWSQHKSKQHYFLNHRVEVRQMQVLSTGPALHESLRNVNLALAQTPYLRSGNQHYYYHHQEQDTGLFAGRVTNFILLRQMRRFSDMPCTSRPIYHRPLMISVVAR